GAFFSSLSDWTSEVEHKGYVPKSNIIKLGSQIAKFLTALGFALTVVDIISNQDLSPAQQIAEIIVWLSSTIFMLQAGAFLAATLFPIPGLIAIIGLYVAITYLTLALISLIENHASIYRRRLWRYV
ncbi:MAG TPA: hypothetical protein VI387_07885, partial [Candidatus Brocadiales bacterium]|nr:hypothetical protein [Candidatus Brocadiales bacterium]